MKKIYAVAVFAMVFIATSAAAINYGLENAEYFSVVMGCLNAIAGGWSVYNVYKSENPE